MSHCHDVYDAFAPVPHGRSATQVVTQCHDLYTAPITRTDDEPAPEPEPPRQPGFA
jgi:hypothetical protein